MVHLHGLLLNNYNNTFLTVSITLLQAVQQLTGIEEDKYSTIYTLEVTWGTRLCSSSYHKSEVSPDRKCFCTLITSCCSTTKRCQSLPFIMLCQRCNKKMFRTVFLKIIAKKCLKLFSTGASTLCHFCIPPHPSRTGFYIILYYTIYSQL